MKKLAMSHQDILVGRRSTLPHPLVAKISFNLGLCVYYKTTILNSKPRWNISALSGLILSMRATGAQKHTSQGGMGLLVHAWWNPFIRLSVTVSEHASISDAGHQALLAYHGKHYEGRKNDKQKYLPRRPPGTLQCVMADPYLEQNEQLKEMALTIQVMHQKLEDSQLELAEVRQHYEEALDEIDEWRSRGGLPKINEVEDIPRLTPRKRCYPGCRCSHTVFKK